jgi:type II secretory ATPase GspE/PulE/Tfp pilus assembly ATPase PilB-like protein
MPDISRQIWAVKHQEEEKRVKQTARSLNLEYVDLIGYPYAADALLAVPKKELIRFQIIPYLKAGRRVKIALPKQPSASLKNQLQAYFPKFELNFALCSTTSFKAGLLAYDRLKLKQTRSQKDKAKKTETEFAKLIKNISDIASHLKKVSTSELLELILNGAVITRASDIHLEPSQEDCRLRFRIDGILQDVTKLSHQQYQALNSRIKNLARLKLNITAKPQDGRFTTQAAGHPLDIRVSSLPGANGEDIVLRLLLSDTPLLTLKQLGFHSQAYRLILEAIKKPHGMILTTGPTGSGKTTTLYAILSQLNHPPVKIITIEDPIEYRISGVNQTQVNESSGYTFVNALSSAIRQDPDIIVVGEIRDPDTAKIALQAAMTGHLVLTSLHTNTASGAIPRLLDMGIEPYLLAGSINLILAQRLVRRICRECRGRDKNCPACQGSGFRGQLAIVEALKPTTEFNELITRKASVQEFEIKAKELGMKTMLQDGLDKVKDGLTTKEEIERVTRE